MDEWVMRPVGYIRSSYTDTSQVPKGFGTIHTINFTRDHGDGTMAHEWGHGVRR